MTEIAESDVVGFKLAGGEDAQAIAEAVRIRYPDARIEVFPAYFSVERAGRIDIDMREVSETLGRPYGVSEFMVTMSSYHGRIEVTGERVTLSAEIARRDREGER
jgi:hypothetical protein